MTKTLSLRFVRAVASASAIVLLAACDGGSSTKSAAPVPVPSPVNAPIPEATYDHGLTDVARVLAGQVPEDEGRFARLTKRASWKRHAVDLDANWSRSEQTRFSVMRTWRDQEFGPIADKCDTLFYPFGGPDALNAVLLFPKCTTYLLFGLEPLGTVPALDTLTEKRLDALTVELRKAMADIFQRNYFITSRMGRDLHTREIDGNLGVFLVFLARLDCHIVGIEHDGPWKTWDVAGVTIKFALPHASRVQSLTYIKVDMADKAFSKKTGLLTYIKGLGTVTSFVKSASYLMHDNQFSIVRSMVLDQSRMLLEDDSGIPYRFFKAQDWEISLYGNYKKPVKDFNYGFQKDLNALYKQPGVARPLPFSFGYHWSDEGSSVMLMVSRTRQ